MKGVREALWHAGKTILLCCSLVCCPLDFYTHTWPLLSLSLTHTHTHTHTQTSRISQPSFQFSHLFSVIGALWAGPPGPGVPRTARLSDKTPQTLFHYEAMIGAAAWSDAHNTHAHTHAYVHMKETPRAHKGIYTHSSPASLSSFFSSHCMSCMCSA